MESPPLPSPFASDSPSSSTPKGHKTPGQAERHGCGEASLGEVESHEASGQLCASEHWGPSPGPVSLTHPEVHGVTY